MSSKVFHYEDEPDWFPLEWILPLEECAAFMYMGWLEVDGQKLHHYKHEWSRRYLFVNDAFETFRYIGGDAYLPQARSRAIEHVFEHGRWTAQAVRDMLAYHETDNGQAPR